MSERINTIVRSNGFHRTMVAVILLAGVLAGLETSPALMERHGSLLHTLDAVVLVAFLGEMALRVTPAARERASFTSCPQGFAQIAPCGTFQWDGRDAANR